MDSASESQLEVAQAAVQASDEASGYVSPDSENGPAQVQEGAAGGRPDVQPPAAVAGSARQSGRLRVAQAPPPQRGGGRAPAGRSQSVQRSAPSSSRSQRPPTQSRTEQGDWARPAPANAGEPRRRERPRSASRGREGPQAEWDAEPYDQEIGDMPDAPRAGSRGVGPNGQSLEPATGSRSRAHGTVSSADQMETIGQLDDGSGIWSSARLQQFANAGGLAARSSKSRRLSARGPPAQDEILQVTTEDVCAVFGRDRAAVLRVNGVPMQDQQQKTWKTRSAQQTQLRAAGFHVPADFCPTWFFFTF